MTFRTECAWSIHLQRDGTARHEIELKLYDLRGALNSSVVQVLFVDLKGVYRDPRAHAGDGTPIRIDHGRAPDAMSNRLSLKVRDMEFLASHAEPAIVHVAFTQAGALSRLGSVEFYLLDFNGTGLQALSWKILVHTPRLSLGQRALQCLTTKLGHPAYPIWSFETATEAARGLVDGPARKVEYVSGRVVPGSGVAFGSRFSINVLAWLLSIIVSLGIGVAAIMLAEMMR